MASEAQLQANRANAAHSTGPTTEAGKQISALNNFRHGLASSQLVIEGEDPQGFADLCADFVQEYLPATPTERALVQNMAQHYWLSQRALSLQKRTFLSPIVVLADLLQTFARYQTTNARGFDRCLNQLLKLRAAHSKQQIGFESQKTKEVIDNSKMNAADSRTKLQDARTHLQEAKTEAVHQLIHLRATGALRLPAVRSAALPTDAVPGSHKQPAAA